MRSQREQMYRDWLFQLKEAHNDCDSDDFDFLLGVGFRMQWLQFEDVIFWSSCK